MIQKPEDHLVFMKQYLHLAAKKLDISNIILIAPESFGRFRISIYKLFKIKLYFLRVKKKNFIYTDRKALAKILQKELGVYPLSLKDLRKVYSQQNVRRIQIFVIIFSRNKFFLLGYLLLRGIRRSCTCNEKSIRKRSFS